MTGPAHGSTASMDGAWDEVERAARGYYGGRWVMLRHHPRPLTQAELRLSRRKIIELYQRHGDDVGAVKRGYNEWCEVRGF